MSRLHKRKKTKKVRVVHFFHIKGLWSHFFALCTVGVAAWLLLSPFADTNPSWKQPENLSANASLEHVQGVFSLPKRFITITQDTDGQTFLVNGEKQPSLYLRPGQTVRLIFQNDTTQGIYDLTVADQDVYIVSLYGKVPEQVIAARSITLLPGKSIEILFTPTWYGELPLQMFYHTQNGRNYEKALLMHIRVFGLPMLPSPLPITLTQ